MRRFAKLCTIALLSAASACGRSQGEALAQRYCGACHMYPSPELLDKSTWRTAVLPQMAPRLGAGDQSLTAQMSRSPHMTLLTSGVSPEQWDRIVAFYVERAPAALPEQTLPAEPGLDPGAFSAGPFVRGLESSAIITLLQADSAHRRIFIGEAATNVLRVLDWNRRPLATLALRSPPTGVIAEAEGILVLESGILEPNDESRGTLARYDFLPGGRLRLDRVLIDSLFRPVFARRFDADGDRRDDFLICEFGDNRGRLALYRNTGTTYERRVLDATPGAIRFEIRDLTQDGHPDIVALFAQGDERITLFVNDGRGDFSQRRVLARFPPVYGSMYFAMHDFNGDGAPDIVYANGDNFDFSRILKPYHGIRILENDGANGFRERYFFPMYGAAQAAVADFDRDGDLDIVATSNFSDPQRHPERAILFFENSGGPGDPYRFTPSAFTIASGSQWNLMAIADLNLDGRGPDVLVGAMRLENIMRLQRGAGPPGERGEPLLLLENRATPRE